MTDAVLEKIWEILVCHCGARADGLGDFLDLCSLVDQDRHVTEYRFCGSFGFGGKVWIKPGKIPYVTCYQEDQTSERKAMIQAANNALAALMVNA